MGTAVRDGLVPASRAATDTALAAARAGERRGPSPDEHGAAGGAPVLRGAHGRPEERRSI